MTYHYLEFVASRSTCDKLFGHASAGCTWAMPAIWAVSSPWVGLFGSEQWLHSCFIQSCMRIHLLIEMVDTLFEHSSSLVMDMVPPHSKTICYEDVLDTWEPPTRLNRTNKNVALIWSPLTGFLNRTESGKHLITQWESEEIGKMTPCSSPSLGSWANSMPDSGSSMWWAWSSRSMAENRMLSSMDSWDYCWVCKESPILMILICLKRLWI